MANRRKEFRFPWEVRQLLILALIGDKSGGVTPPDDNEADRFLSSLEKIIGRQTGWTGTDIFGDMEKGLSEDVVTIFLAMILAKILRDNGIDSDTLAVAFHDKNLIEMIDAASRLLKTIN